MGIFPLLEQTLLNIFIQFYSKLPLFYKGKSTSSYPCIHSFAISILNCSYDTNTQLRTDFTRHHQFIYALNQLYSHEKLSFLRSAFIWCLLFMTIILSCHKADLSKPSEGLTPTEKFFTNHRSSDVLEKVLISFLERKNKKQPFVEATVRKIGYPVWDKIIKRAAKINHIAVNGVGVVQKKATSVTDNSDVYFVPFVRDSQNHVNAAMIITTSSTDTTIGYACDWQYKGMLSNNTSILNGKAEKFAVFFMNFDNLVFGHTSFKITDNLLFRTADNASAQGVMVKLGRDTQQQVVKTNSLNVTCADVTVYTIDCPWLNRGDVCPGPKAPGETCDHCLTYCMKASSLTVCWEETVIEDYPPSGGTGSPGDGTGGGGSVPPSDPCSGGGTPPAPTSNKPGSQVVRIGITSAPPPSPCDPGWTPSPDPYAIPDANGFYYDRIADLENFISDDNNTLLPCNALSLFKQVSQDFFQDLTTFTAPQAVKDRIQNIINTNSNFTKDNLFIQTLEDAKGAIVNCDFFPVHISTMPTINGQVQTPETLLEYFRLHMNDFISSTSIVSFSPYIGQGLDETTKWNQSGANSLSTLVHIPLVSVNDGTVIESGYNIAGPPADDSYTFSTMHSPLDAYHPVSGNRRFGIYQDKAGSLVFYIAGVDRISTNGIRLGNTLASYFKQDGFTKADILWRDIQSNFLNFINNNGGTANKFVGLPDFIVRPNWSNVEKYLKKQITFEQLRRSLGC